MPLVFEQTRRFENLQMPRRCRPGLLEHAGDLSGGHRPTLEIDRQQDAAARGMREQDERKESIFRQAVDAEKNKTDLLEKRFAEALRKAKETPDTGKPLREFDLD